MKTRPIFVTGTDTGVGKTLVTTLLALKIRQQGFSVGVCKPFASGCKWENGVLVSEDARFLQKNLGLKETLEDINPIRVEKPLAPLIAARMEGVSTQDWRQIAAATVEHLGNKYQFVIVEGVGGINVPVGEEDGKIWTIGEWAQELQCVSVVVARRVLGTVNHTLLTLEKTPDVRGIVFCDSVTIEADDLAALTGPELIEKMTGVPILGTIPFLGDLGDEKNAALLETVAASLQFEL